MTIYQEKLHNIFYITIHDNGNYKSAATYEITSNTGQVWIHKSLNDFARIYGYNNSALGKVLHNLATHHKDIIKVERIS